MVALVAVGELTAFEARADESVDIRVDWAASVGPVKPVNGVGQPPMIGGPKSFELMHYLKEAGIPYSRLHDVGGWLGRALWVDIPNVFPDFDADENDPAHYDFEFTDALMKALVANGVEPYFRLGVTIENFAAQGYRPRRTAPPKDFAKWARICEHIVRHYTEGWADGLRMKVAYWEVWNEPENNPEIERNPMWRAAFSDYIRFYGVVAPYLKAKFPHLKIGGFGSCGFYAGVGSDAVPAANSSPRKEYFVHCSHEFLKAVRENGWPLDFFSYHSYSAPAEALRQARFADEHLNEYGFTRDRTERHLNEWLPYVKHENLGSAHQAAGVAAEMIGLQNGPCDVACLYDARCGIGNYSPLFDPLTYRPHKAYFAFTAFNELRKLGTAVRTASSSKDVWVAAARGASGAAVMIANDSAVDVRPRFDFGGRRAGHHRMTDAGRTDARAEGAPGLLPAHSFCVILLEEPDVASWIAGSYVPPAEGDDAAFFREAPNDVVERRFRVRDAAVSRAMWRVAAPGMRLLQVNGECVSPTALPPWTPYAKRVLEESFDVTARIRRGQENVLRVELGNGWFNPLPLRMWYVYNLREALATGVPCVKATLEIAYADGVCETVVTDPAWRASEGQVLCNSIYMGEKVDLRRPVSFTRPARIVEGPKGAVCPAGDFPKVVVYDRWRAKGVSAVSNGVWLVDMGVNFAGSFRAVLRNVRDGQVVRFRKGELKFADGTVNTMSAVAGQIKKPERGPLFGIAEECDTVICRAAAELAFESRLAFHVFRYIQVEGLDTPPQAEDFEALAWSADVKDRSGFTCSNERLNRLHEICQRTFRSNLQSVQSDCPGREKFGYGGDIACTADAFWSNYDMRAFYRKTVRDFLDEAAEDGIITETAPYVGIGSRPVFPDRADPVRRAAPMGWAVGLPVLLDSLVRYAGDLEIVREAYPALTRYIALVRARYPQDDIPPCLGDWIPAVDAEKADTRMSALAHWHQFVRLTAKFARLLEKPGDAARYEGLAAEIAAKFRREHVRGGVVAKGSQGDQLFGLYHGLIDAADEPAAYARLRADIVRRGPALTTGIFATKYMLELLPLRGDWDLAGEVVAHRGCPGWMEMMERGATTLWEDWREERCLNAHSNCHPMFGSVDEWMIRHVLGISVCADAVGCDKVRIEPHAVAGVTSASGWFDTPRGRITVSWRLKDGRLEVRKDVPRGIMVIGQGNSDGAIGRTETYVDFARGKWDAAAWIVAKSPRWDYCHGFTQKDGWIENETPDIPPEEVYRKHHSTSYSCMILRERLGLGATVSTTTGWDWLMAPLIVIAPELGVGKDGRTKELREHWEIVVYNEGINVWHHFWSAEAGPSHIKAASLKLPKGAQFKANERHLLAVKVARNKRGRKEMVCTCGGYELQYVDDALPEEFQAGIIGCEGRNFFWDFSVK